MTEDKDLISIEGYIDCIIFNNSDNGYTVFGLSCETADIVCVGNVIDLSEGQYITVSGRFINHPTYGEQFQIESLQIKEPRTKEAFLRFISSGIVPGIRKKNGEKIAKRFGDDSYRIMCEEPETLAKEIKGISLEQAYRFSEFLVENKEVSDAYIFMQKYGIGSGLAKRIYECFGQRIYTVIKNNPYELAENISLVGFKTVEEIVKKTGISVKDEDRFRAAVIYALEKAGSEGHTYLPVERLKEEVTELTGSVFQDFDIVISDLSIEGKIVSKILPSDDKGQVTAIYLPNAYKTELNVAWKLKRLLEGYGSGEYPELKDEVIDRVSGIQLDDKQKEAVRKALNSSVSVITGGPGTGKTTVINTIIRLFEEKGNKVKLAAPTGRASKKMSEACGHEATTIHRLLGYTPVSSDEDRFGFNNGGMKFSHNEENPISCNVVVIDEMSMVDISLMSHLLNAIAPGTGVILVGDENQLPSVGAGKVLADIIESKCCPVVRLEKIFRQAAESDIILNAHKINKGEDVDLDKRSKDFLFIERNDPDRIISAMRTLLTEKLPEYVNADKNEIQILSISRTSKLGIIRLNEIMQSLINPKEKGKAEKKYGDTIFREGDKVMQIKNDYQLEWTMFDASTGLKESGMGVFNGDIGVITDINLFSEQVTVLYDDEKEVKYDFDRLDQLELAYAITVHKAQGSEYPGVIIPMYPGPRMLMNRRLLYTAVTRARKCVCLVGLKDSFNVMKNSEYEFKRYSSLVYRIKEVIKEDEF